MYSPHSLYTPHQAFQGVKSSGLYTKKYGNHVNEKVKLYFIVKLVPIILITIHSLIGLLLYQSSD